MKEYKLFMDVSGDVLNDIAKENDVQLLPMYFIIGGESHIYTDGGEGISHVDFYKYVKNRVNISTTQITPNMYVDYFDETLKSGYSALYLCLSGGLSSTFDAACLAAKSLKEKYPDVDLVPVNSLQATVGMGLLCERMIENHKKGLDILQNAADLEAMRSHITTTGVVDDLDALKRGGRISSAVAMIGGMLNFKPIILVKENGTLQMSTKTHGVKKALKYMANLFDETHDPNFDVVYLMHADEEPNCQILQNMLFEKYPNLQIRKRFLSPIIGAHLGSGLVGIGFFKKV